MRVAYLVNRYPAVSHTFVRREIRALEARGIAVDRYSLRPVEDSLTDPQDRAEAARTRALLGPWPVLARSVAAGAIRNAPEVLRCAASAASLGLRSERGALRHLGYLAEAVALRRELARRPVDHLHAHFGTNSATVAWLCRRLGGPPFSVTVHGPEELDKPRELALGRKAADAAFVATVSSFGRSQMMRWTAPEHWDRLHEVRCGLSRSELAPEPEPVPAAPRLVCVGRLCEQKGQLLLVEAARRLAQAGLVFELVLAGDGPMRGAIDSAIREKGLEQRVRVTGWLSGEQVRGQLKRARALVLPSFAEGLPVVLMEAMAAGRPVLSTYVAGIPELVVPGRNGFLVPAGDVNQLTLAMRSLLEASPADLTAMGRRGRETVGTRHMVENEAEKLERLFRESAGRGIRLPERRVEAVTTSLIGRRTAEEARRC